MRADIMHMATEVCMARTERNPEHRSDPSPLEVIELLEGGDCDDPIGRAALLVLVTPGLLPLKDARAQKLPEELIEAAALCEAASMEAAAGGQNGE